MSKVLVIGPNFYNYSRAVAKAFERLGWEVVLETYDNPVHPYTASMKWRWKLSRDRDGMYHASQIKYNSLIESRFKQDQPDLVFIMNGKILLTETLDLFRKSSRVAMWMFDSRTKAQVETSHIDHVDTMLCYDMDDVRWYRSQGKEAHFLPQACDTDVYKPLGLDKDIDILFVGNIWNSPKRQEYLMAVIENFPGHKIEFHGLHHPWYKGIKSWITRPYKHIFTNRTLAPSEVNEHYNRARVVINIHQEQLGNGANPRVFEISGSGAYQVCDSNGYVCGIYPEGTVGFYSDKDGLIRAIRNGLSTDTAEKSRACQETVREYHTFEKRIQGALDIIFTARQERRLPYQNDTL